MAMELHVCCGDDDQAIRAKRAALLDGIDGAREDIDVTLDGGDALVQAVNSPSLFGPRRVVAAEGIESLDDSRLSALLGAAAQSNAYVVARASGALRPTLKKALATIGQVHSASAPRGKGVGMRVGEICASHGLRLRPQVQQLIVERCGHDLDRVASLCWQLSVMGMTTADARQVTVLLGTSAAPGVPWAVTDHLERGDAAGALTVTANLVPIAVLAYLASQVEQLGRCVDAGITSADVAQSKLGISHRFQAERLVRTASRMGPDGVRAAWDIVVAADRAAKSQLGQQVALDVALTRLAPLWGPKPRR